LVGKFVEKRLLLWTWWWALGFHKKWQIYWHVPNLYTESKIRLEYSFHAASFIKFFLFWVWNIHLHLELHRASTIHKSLNHILWEKHSIKECESPSNMDIYVPFSILLFEWGPQKARNFCGTIQFRSPFSTLWSKENEGTWDTVLLLHRTQST
jgi:hypothetical protein